MSNGTFLSREEFRRIGKATCSLDQVSDIQYINSQDIQKRNDTHVADVNRMLGEA